MKRYRILFIALLLLGTAAPLSAEPTAGETTFLGPFIGLGAKLHRDNQTPHPVLFYGTDLGFSYLHDNKIHFLFGDSIGVAERLAPIEEQSSGRFRDDAFGWVDLTEWPDAKQFSKDNVPVLRIAQNAGTSEASALNPGMVMDTFKTPEAGFSNGAREFAIFFSARNQVCASNRDCASHLHCNTDFGYSGLSPAAADDLGISWVCIDGEDNCTSNTLPADLEGGKPNSGFCLDPSSTVYSSSLAGNLSAVAWMQRVAVRSLDDQRRYTPIADWYTTKFYNTTAHAVESFVPETASLQQHDYNAVRKAGGKNQKVLLWGRPGFVGVGKNGRYLGLYFAYVDMPKDETSTWNVNYFTGVDSNGVPRFSNDERDAQPVDLDSTQPGAQPREPHDLTGQMGITWIDQLKKWVMFYGGGTSNTAVMADSDCGLLGVFARDECHDVVLGNGAIRMRTADSPWGPWSPPQDVLVGGDPKVAGSGQFGVGGILHHPACKEAGCAPHSDVPGFDEKVEYGYLYAPNIIEPWTVSNGDGVDVIWNVSTWDPYRVVLMRTHIRK